MVERATLNKPNTYLTKCPLKMWFPAYVKNGDIGNARKVFDKMPERNVVSWKAMITGYMREKSGVDKWFELLGLMPERNAVTYACVITGFVRSGRMRKAREVYDGMYRELRDLFCSNALMNGYLKMGRLEDAVRVYEGMVVKNVVSWSAMVDGYCKLGEVGKARELFDGIPERNVVTWTVMIDGYMKASCFEDGFGLFREMRRENGIKIASNTLTVVFEGCGRFDRYKEGVQVHALVMRMGFAFDTFLGNSVITMYIRLGDLDLALKLFNIMERKDTVSWNSLIGGYIQAEEIEHAYKIFNMMPYKDVYSWTTMITGFSNKGLTEKSVELFKMMPHKDDIAWTALISGFTSNGEYEESIRWFIQKLRTSVKPNTLACSSVLSSSASLATLNQGVQIHTHVLKSMDTLNLEYDGFAYTGYCKNGKLKNAVIPLDKMVQSNNITLTGPHISNSVIDGGGRRRMMAAGNGW